jgi:hypothetical protein
MVIGPFLPPRRRRLGKLLGRGLGSVCLPFVLLVVAATDFFLGGGFHLFSLVVCLFLG